MTWTDPRTWVAGEKPSAATLNTHIRDNFKTLGDPWTSYSPSWSSTSTPPTLGNGTLNGKYIQAGKLVIFRIDLTIGSTTTAGTGTYTLSLPVAAGHPVNSVIAASAHFFDSSGSAYWAHVAYLAATGGGDTVALSTNNARWAATVPVAPATGDVISVAGSYEAA